MIRSAIIILLLTQATLLQTATAAPEKSVHTAAQHITLHMTAAKRIASADANGHLKVTWQAIEGQSSIAPGDVVRYTILAHNPLDHAIRSFVITQPVPKGTEYIPQSAASDPDSNAQITASIDSGATFSDKPTIEVTGSDGTLRREPAPASQYTHLRWTLGSSLAASSSVTVSCEVRVR
jgi:uncharacterized repeat protein (TIGR01451 family)